MLNKISSRFRDSTNRLMHWIIYKSLKIKQNALFDIGSNVNMPTTLNDVGICFMDMHKPADALDYLQRSLKIYEKASFDIESKVSVALTLNNIGWCFMDMHKPADALDYLQ